MTKKRNMNPYRPKTDADLEALAWDIVSGHVFHSIYNGVPDKDIQLVFMILSFVDEEYIDWLKANNIRAFYERMDKAMPRSVNGMPMFMSCTPINLEDSKQLDVKVQEIRKIRADRMKDSTKPEV